MLVVVAVRVLWLQVLQGLLVEAWVDGWLDHGVRKLLVHLQYAASNILNLDDPVAQLFPLPKPIDHKQLRFPAEHMVLQYLAADSFFLNVTDIAIVKSKYEFQKLFIELVFCKPIKYFVDPRLPKLEFNFGFCPF